MNQCCYCGNATPEDLRPYGPKGAQVCFDCAMATPEREAEAKRQFCSLLNAAGDVVVLTQDGPVPLDGGKQ